MSKIIISGGLGFIGTNLISELLKENHQILNLDKNGYSSNKFFLRSEIWERFEFSSISSWMSELLISLPSKK